MPKRSKHFKPITTRETSLLEPLSLRERGRGEGTRNAQTRREAEPSSGPSGHLLPEGEGKPVARRPGAGRDPAPLHSGTEWQSRDFVHALSEDKLPRRNKLQARAYKSSGRFPIIDQGQNEIAGWTDDKSLVIADALPYVVFGDHTRAFKYVDTPFVLGADGTQLLKPSREYCPRFFYYACLHIDLPSRGYNRHFTFLKEKSLPLPPPSEQQKIAAVLWKLQRAIATQDRLLAATADLKQSAMQRLFTHGLKGEPLKDTEIGPMPESWALATLGDLAETTSGGTPNRAEAKYYGGNILWAKSGELNDGYITDTEERITTEGLKHSSAKLFSPGTLLIAMYGATVGKTTILEVKAATNQAVCAIFPNTNKTEAEFIRYSLIYDRPELLNRRYGGAQPNISQTVLRNFSIRLPSLNEQHAIAATLATLDRKLAHHRAKRATLHDLFETLLHKLMTAEIRVADLDIDTSEVADHFADADKMVGKLGKSASANQFPDVREMVPKGHGTPPNRSTRP